MLPIGVEPMNFWAPTVQMLYQYISHKKLMEAKDVIILKYSAGFKFNSPSRFHRCVKVPYFLD